MGFTFRFETLLKVRKIKEDLAQQAFSQAQRHCSNLETLKNLRIEAQSGVQDELSSRMQAGLAASELKQYCDYLSFLDDNIKEIDRNLAAAKKQLDEKRGHMIAAQREHRAIERLKEMDGQHYKDEQNRTEMYFIDEMAIQRHGGRR